MPYYKLTYKYIFLIFVRNMMTLIFMNFGEHLKECLRSLSFEAAEYCKKLKAERKQMQNEAEILKQEIESLNVQIRSVDFK